MGLDQYLYFVDAEKVPTETVDLDSFEPDDIEDYQYLNTWGEWCDAGVEGLPAIENVWSEEQPPHPHVKIYWRKANAIHRHFDTLAMRRTEAAKALQKGFKPEELMLGRDDTLMGNRNGIDNCCPFEVRHEDVMDLVFSCKKVLDAKDDPAKVKREGAAYLPTQTGFFFGGTEYDDYYLQELEATVEELQPWIDNEDFRKGKIRAFYVAWW